MPAKSVRLRYKGAVSPIDVPLAHLAGIEHGQEVNVPPEVAGRVAGDWLAVVDPSGAIPPAAISEPLARQLAPDHHFLHRAEDGTWHSQDPGEGLLAQTDNWEPLDAEQKPPAAGDLKQKG